MGPGYASRSRTGFLAGEKGEVELQEKGRNDHFMVTGRTTWDLSRAPIEKGTNWGTSLLELPAMANVTTLLVESRTWMDREQAVPYLTSFHLKSQQELKEWTETVASARRDFLKHFCYEIFTRYVFPCSLIEDSDQ